MIWNQVTFVKMWPWNENIKQTSRLNLRKFSLSHRVVDDWNPLPRKVVEARYVEHFITELEEAWKDIRFLHAAL